MTFSGKTGSPIADLTPKASWSHPRGYSFDIFHCCHLLVKNEFSSVEFAVGYSLTCMVLACMLSHVQLFVTPGTAAHQLPLSMGFSRQEHWSGLPFPSPRDLAHAWIKLASPVSPAWAGRFFTTEPPGKLTVT